jgi:FAD/FMN-containing dehydrogenase
VPIPIEDASGYTGHADEVVTPSCFEEAAAVLARCATRRTPVTVSGAGTGVTGGRCPDGGVLLSLDRLQGLDVGPGVARAGAGVPLSDLHSAAQARGQFYPPDPTEWSASLGGSIATNASGARSFLYGPTRRWLRALTVAFMDGSVRTFQRGDRLDFPYTPLPATRARKSTAGYYLRENLEWIDLLCGSEGTLAVVLEAEVELLPAPRSLLTGVVFFPSIEGALAAVDVWRPVPQLRMLEYFDGPSLALLRTRYTEIPAEAGAALLVEQVLDNLPGDPVDEWLERLDAAGALGEESWFGEAPADRERFRAFRHVLPELVNDEVRRRGFQKLGTDFAVPVGRNREMMAFYLQQLDQRFRDNYLIFGHIGDAHVHVNILPSSAQDAADARDLMVVFARRAVSLGGTVSAEHGLGKRKAHLLNIEFSEAQIEAMCEVKRRLDPDWLLGLGTLLPVRR